MSRPSAWIVAPGAKKSSSGMAFIHLSHVD
jgi:hypothetical protein